MQEIYFFETLFEAYKPKNIFVVGNAFGWSTILFSLLNPDAKVIAIDAGIEGKDNNMGIDLTNKIGCEENLDLKVIKGLSPQDVGSVISSEFQEKVDFVFIDGLHTEQQQELDFNAVHEFCSQTSIIVFHDVINHNMFEGFLKIAKQSGLNSKLLYRTESGMGVLYPNTIDLSTKWCISAFTEKQEIIDSLKREQKTWSKLFAKAANLLINRLVPK